MLSIAIILMSWALYAGILLKRKMSAMTIAGALLPLAIVCMILTADLALNYAAAQRFVVMGQTVPYGPLTHILFPNLSRNAEDILIAYQAAANCSFLLLIGVIFSTVYSRYQFLAQKAHK